MESEGFARTEENRIEDIRCIIRHDDYFENRYHGLIYIKLHREFVEELTRSRDQTIVKQYNTKISRIGLTKSGLEKRGSFRIDYIHGTTGRRGRGTR